MNVPLPPLTRAQRQAMEAPFLIGDEQLVQTIARLADERGTPMEEIVQLAVADYLRRHERSSSAPEALRKFWDEHPLPLPTGLKADKRFFDSLNDEL